MSLVSTPPLGTPSILAKPKKGSAYLTRFFKRLITGDLAGQTPQDAVYQGREQFVSFRLIEAASAGADAIAEPYALDNNELKLGVIGTLDIQGNVATGSPQPYAKALVLTAVAGTPAAQGGPATITFPYAILAEGFRSKFCLDPICVTFQSACAAIQTWPTPVSSRHTHKGLPIMSMLELVDGTLEFYITVNGISHTWLTDVVTLKLIAEEIETRHRLQPSGTFLKPTPDFLADLAGAYVDAGAVACGQSQALQIWTLVHERFLRMRHSLTQQIAN